MLVAPSGMGDWGIIRVFHEGGRVLDEHLGDFLPTILVFIFPLLVIDVLHIQFFEGDFFGLKPGFSYFPRPTSFWPTLLLGLYYGLRVLLLTVGFVTLRQVMRDSVYSSELKAERRSQSLYTSVKLAFTSPAAGKSDEFSYQRFWEASKGKRLKSVLAVFLGFMLWFLFSVSGMSFSPKGVAAMGLPPWTLFVFTLLIATFTTVLASYVMVVVVVMSGWLWSPKTPILS